MKRANPLPQEIQELMVLVRSGRLFDVQRWIAEGKPTVPPEPYRKSPLRIAIAAGFHSMVEVLLQAGVDQQERNRLLRTAVSKRDFGLVQLFVQNGADPLSVKPQSVLGTSRSDLIQFFLERGLDVVTDQPFAKALQQPTRPMLGIFLGFRDQIPNLRYQIDLALRYHASEGRLKWVSLLLWADANPFVRLPDIGATPDPEVDTTALEEAVRSGHTEVVEKIGLGHPDIDLARLLREACLSGDWNLIEKILNAGAPIRGHGESDPMQCLIWKLSFLLNPIVGRRCEYDIEQFLKTVYSLADRGGRWTPDRSFLNSFRRDLCKLEAALFQKVVLGFHHHRVCSREVLIALIGTPAAKRTLGPRHARCFSRISKR